MITNQEVKPFALDDVPVKEQFPGFRGRFVHTETMTVAYWKIDAGAAIPEHQHIHEQIMQVLKGEFELVVEGVPHRLTAGMIFPLASNVKHGGHAITECEVMDIFSPAREEYK